MAIRIVNKRQDFTQLKNNVWKGVAGGGTKSAGKSFVNFYFSIILELQTIQTDANLSWIYLNASLSGVKLLFCYLVCLCSYRPYEKVVHHY